MLNDGDNDKNDDTLDLLLGDDDLFPSVAPPNHNTPTKTNSHKPEEMLTTASPTDVTEDLGFGFHSGAHYGRTTRGGCQILRLLPPVWPTGETPNDTHTLPRDALHYFNNKE